MLLDDHAVHLPPSLHAEVIRSCCFGLLAWGRTIWTVERDGMIRSEEALPEGPSQ